jgi:hypothetical protein
MTEWERQMALRGLKPSDSHHGWDFRPGGARMRWPAGWVLVGIAIFSAVVWAAIVIIH